MHSYWFWIGHFPIRSYSTIFALAFLLGLGITMYFTRVYGNPGDVEHWWNMGPLCLLGGIVGARAWQVFFFDWSYYSHNLGQIVAVWNGGLSIQGGIVGGFAAGLWYMWRKKLSWWHFADIAAPGLLIGQSIGRDADFMNGSAYGAPTHQNFGVLFPSDTLAAQQYPHQALWPAVVWEAQADIILFAIMLILFQRKKKWPVGTAFVYYVVTYNLMRFFMEMLRGDSPRFALNWDAAQYTALASVLIGILLGVWVFVKNRDRRVDYTGLQQEEIAP